MVTREQIRGEIDRLLVESFEQDRAALTDGANLFDDLGLDSLDAIDMLLSLESFIGQRLNDDDKAGAKNLRTISDVVEFVATIASRGTAAR